MENYFTTNPKTESIKDTIHMLKDKIHYYEKNSPYDIREMANFLTALDVLYGLEDDAWEIENEDEEEYFI